MAIMLSEIEKDIDSCKIALGNKDKQLVKKIIKSSKGNNITNAINKRNI